MEKENQNLRPKGVHWEWAGGSNEFYAVPVLFLDFNIAKNAGAYDRHKAEIAGAAQFSNEKNLLVDDQANGFQKSQTNPLMPSQNLKHSSSLG